MEARKKRQHRIGLGVLKLHFKTCNIHGSSLRLYFCHVKTAYLFAKFLEPSKVSPVLSKLLSLALPHPQRGRPAQPEV